jgi:hypothetical protein
MYVDVYNNMEAGCRISGTSVSGGLSWERIGWQHRLAAEGGSIGRAAASVGRQHRLGSSRPLLPTDAAAQPMLPVERQSGIEGSRVRQRVKKCSRGQLQGRVGRKRAAQEGGSSGRCKRVAASVGSTRLH